MSGHLLSYSGITTKVKAMEKKLIHYEDYQLLSNVKSVSEFVLFFKNQEAYAPYFSEVNEASVHRGEIESILSKTVYESYAKIYHFANKEQRNILKLNFFRFEVTVLDECLKHVLFPESEIDISAFQKVLSEHTVLNLDALQHARSIDEFVNFLYGTEYYSLLNRLLGSNHKTLFDYQTQLNNYYYKKVWKLKDRYLNNQELKDYTEALGTIIDWKNIMSIYRCKKYYSVNAADIIAIVIPITYHLKKEELSAMVQASSMDDFVRILQETKYRIPKEKPTKEDMERSYYERTYQVYRRNSTKNPVSIAPIQFYLYKKEREVDQLTTVLECVRYGIESDATMKYII